MAAHSNDVPDAEVGKRMTTGGYISAQGRQNLPKYHYSGSDNSYLYRLVCSPLAEMLVQSTPQWVAPNLITCLGLLCNIFGHLLVMVYSPDLKSSCPPWVWMVLGISTLVSQTLDNMDGKQARRTGTSSPLGLMLDHGADALNVNLCSINVMALLQVGDYRAMCFSVWFNSCTSFFFATWEEYQTGSLYLGVFNGPTDGLLIVALSFFVTALAEDQFRFWDAEFAFGISRKFAMTGFYTVCVFGTVLGNLLAVKQAISGLRSERSTRMPFVSALLLTIPFCAVLLGGVLGLFCGWSSVFASEPRLFFWCLGLMFLIL
ncbi:unnamed protein product, partial [Polarella glacialis]